MNDRSLSRGSGPPRVQAAESQGVRIIPRRVGVGIAPFNSPECVPVHVTSSSPQPCEVSGEGVGFPSLHDVRLIRYVDHQMMTQGN